MNYMDQIQNAGIVPVVVIEKAKDAVPAANALSAGGIHVMEITYRTSAAPDAIRAVSENCPDMLVGAGTITSLAQCQDAVSRGAKFIVTPGFSREVSAWCCENNIPVLPGCVTPTEIMQALSLGITVVKFFPANVYGGLTAMRALSAPFGKVRFVPTGGVNAENLAEYLAAPYVFAVGGSWICTKQDIAAGNFDKITALSKEAKGCTEHV